MSVPMSQSVCGKPVTLMSEAAKALGLHVQTVRDLIRIHKILTYRVLNSPSGRGIDGPGMAILRGLTVPRAAKSRRQAVGA